jgi:hypothetical protein
MSSKEEDERYFEEVRKRNAELSAKTDRLPLLKALQRIYDATNDWARETHARTRGAEGAIPKPVEYALDEARRRLDDAYGIIR